MKNVVLLTVDALRKDVLGCYGNPDQLSPFIDSLAKKGLVFTGAHSIAPYTQASFPGILTSSYLFDYPISEYLSAKRTLISETLAKANIVCAAFHSNPHMSAFFGWNRGWQHFYDSMQEDVDPMNPFIGGNVINQKIDAWLTSHLKGNNGAPFFIWLHYMDLHEPYTPDRKYVQMVDPTITLGKEEMFKLFKEVVIPRDTSNPETVMRLKKLYQAHVREVDDYTKMLFDILDKHHVMDNTVVVITSDHGEEFNEHGGLSHDGKMYSELVCTPLIVHNYESEKSRVSDSLVSGIDIAPTIVNIFGLKPEANFQGQSFLPPQRYPDKGCYGESIGKLSHKIKPTDKPAYYYREQDVKIIYREEESRWEMYDLQADPQEVNNIIETSPAAGKIKRKLTPRIGRQAN